MAVGFEAKATITADMSGFVAAARSAAQAADTFTASLKELNSQLNQAQRLGRSAAGIFDPFGEAADQMGEASREAADSGQLLRQAMSEQADATNGALRAQQAANDQSERTVRSNQDAADSMSGLARRIFDTRRRLEELGEATEGNFTSTQGISKATEAYTKELTRLEAALAKRSEAQREAAQRTMALLEANRTHQAVMRETGKEMNLQLGMLQRTGTELEAMGRRLNSLSQLQERFQEIQSASGRLTQEQAESYEAVNRSLQQTQDAYAQLDSRQQQRVDRARAEAQSTQLIAEANRQLAADARSAAQAAREQAKASQVSTAELNKMAKELEKYTSLQQRFRELQTANGQLTQEQAAQFQTVNTALQQTQAAYAQLGAAEQQRVDTAREQIQVTQAVAQADRDLTSAERELAKAAEQSNSIFSRSTISMFALRSAVGDLDNTLFTIQDTLIQVGEGMAVAFAGQDVAIGHLSRVTQESAEFVDNLTDSFRRMSTEIPIAFEELANIGRMGAQVGIADDQLVTFTRTVALFSATTDVAAEQAATMFGRVQELTGLSQEQIPNMGAAISALGSSSAATEGQILKMAEQISTVSQQSGLTAQSVLGLAGALASLGVRPELARGALQRTLLEIDQAAKGASDKSQGLADALGLTVNEMTELRGSMSREDFFFTFLEGMEQTRQAGGDLNQTLREIGFRNVQDIQVLSVLGTNWTQVAQSINLANEEFQANNFLQEEADRLFARLTQQVLIASNAWDNLRARVVEALTPVLLVITQAVTASLEWAAASDAVVNSLAGLAIAGTLLLTFTALGRVVSFLAEGWLAWLTLLSALRTRAANAAVANTALAASTVASAAAARGAGAATSVYLAITGTAAARTAAFSGAMNGVAVASAAAAGGITRAATAMALFARAHPVLAIAGAITVVAGLAAAYDGLNTTVEENNKRVLKANQAHFDAAGGVNALTSAIQSDTQAWKDFSGGLLFSIRSFEDVGEVAEQTARETLELENRTRDLSGQLDIAGRAASNTGDGFDGATLSASEMQRELKLIDPELQDITATARETEYAVGAMALAWAQGAFEASLLSSSLTESAEAFAVVQGMDVDFGAALAAEMYQAGAGADYLRDQAGQLRSEMSGYREATLEAREATSGWGQAIIGGIPILGSYITMALGSKDATDEAVVGLEEQADALEAISLQMDISARAAQFMNGTMVDLGNGTSVAVSELGDLNDETALLNATMDGTSITVQELRDAFSGMIDPAGTWQELTQEAADAAEEAEVSFTRLGASSLPEFNARMRESEEVLLDNITNMLRISHEAGPDVAASLIKMGEAGTDMGFALVEALDEGNIDDFESAVAQLGSSSEIAVGSLVDSFTRISGATDEAREDAVALFNDLNEKFQEGSIELPELASELSEGLDDILGETEIALTAAIDETQMAQEMSRVSAILEAWAADQGLDLPPVHLEIGEAETALQELTHKFDTLGQVGLGFSLNMQNVLRGIGSPIADALADDIAAAEQLYHDGELDADEFRARVNEILEQVEAEFDIDVRDEEARSDMDRLSGDIEGTASSTEAVFTPAVLGGPAEGEMSTLTQGLISKADETDPTVVPEVNRPPSEAELAGLLALLESNADDTVPVVEPTTAAARAKAEMVALANALYSLARVASRGVVITPRINTGPAKSGMSSLMWALASVASRGVYVPVYPYQAGSISKASLIRAADGGWVNGTGGPRQDNIPAWLSSGEFVVNARAARIWGSLLEDINSGAEPNMELRSARGVDDFAPDQVRPDVFGRTNPRAAASLMRSVAAASTAPRAGTQITVNNTYPQAEPTSVTINRSLAYKSVLDGVSAP